MTLSLSIRPAFQLLQLLDLDLTGGASESIFPEVEAFLQASADHQKAIEYAARRKQADRYRSVVDFLTCEIFPELQRSCQRFYDGRGPRLAGLITPAQRLWISWHILRALQVAYEAFCEQRKLSWSGLVSEVRAAS